MTPGWKAIAVIVLACVGAAPPPRGTKAVRAYPDEPLPPGAVARLGTNRHRSTASALVFVDGGRTLLTATGGRTLGRLDADTGRLRTEAHLPGPVSDRSWFSPDGRILAVPEAGGIGLWDTATARRRGRLAVSATFAVFAPDGRTLATVESAKGSGVIRLWNLASGKGRLFARLTDRIHDLAFGPEGNRLFAAMDGRCLCWDVASGRQIWKNDHTAPRLAVSPDGRTLLTTGSRQGHLYLWDAATGQRSATLQSPMGWTMTLAFAPDGRTFAQGTDAGVFLWDVGDRRLRHRFDRAGPHVAFAPDSRSVVTLGPLLQRWDTKSGKPLYPNTRAHGHLGAVTALAFAPDGRALASCGEDHSVRLWNLAGGGHRVLRRDAASVRRVSVRDDLSRFMVQAGVPPAFTLDGRFLVTATSGGRLVLTEVATGKEVRRFSFPASRSWTEVSAARLASDGTTLLALAETTSLTSTIEFDTPLRGWDVTTGKEVLATKVPQQPGALSPDGSLLLLGGTGKLREVPGGEERPLLGGADSVGSPFAFSPDGRLLAVAEPGFLVSDSGPAKALRVHEVLTGRQVARLAAPLGYCQAVAFSPDGRLLAAAGPDALYVWEAATGRRLLTLSARGRLTGWTPAGFATCLGFAPNGNVLATGHADGTILLWSMADARRQLTRPAPGAIDLEACWSDLASSNARVAWAAIDRLAGRPAPALALLRRLLRPDSVEPRWLAARLSDLDSSSFATREAATRELKRVVESVRGELRREREGAKSAEVRWRLRAILATKRPVVPPPAVVRQLRAVAVLERLGSTGAVALLRELARGGMEARLTREAKAAVRRLEKR
jgi:WD40 repeat protein